MKREDVADFIAGERCGIESAISNLGHVDKSLLTSFESVKVDEFRATLQQINKDMALFCAHLRAKF